MYNVQKIGVDHKKVDKFQCKIYKEAKDREGNKVDIFDSFYTTTKNELIAVITDLQKQIDSKTAMLAEIDIEITRLKEK